MKLSSVPYCGLFIDYLQQHWFPFISCDDRQGSQTPVTCLVWMLPDPLLDVYTPTDTPLENKVFWVFGGKNFTQMHQSAACCFYSIAWVAEEFVFVHRDLPHLLSLLLNIHILDNHKGIVNSFESGEKFSKVYQKLTCPALVRTLVRVLQRIRIYIFIQRKRWGTGRGTCPSHCRR